MAKVYVLAGILTVLSVAGLAWLLIARFGLAIFRAKKEKVSEEEPPDGARWHRPADGGPGYWV